MSVGVGSDVSAAALNVLIDAVEDLLRDRFNDRSFLVYAADITPTVPLGDVFIFGTTSNLNVSGTQYDTSEETPPNPTGGSVISSDPDTKVVWVTGYSSYLTLNRKKVTYLGTTYFLGLDRAERFEPERVADLCVEDYTDPIAGDTGTFTVREHWDRFGCMRIHNGNRFDIQVDFESGATGFSLPPYGVVALKRSSATSEWDIAGRTFYLFQTSAGIAATYKAQYDGQTNGCLETLWSIMETREDWARVDYQPDQNDTAAHRLTLGSFSGTVDPVGTHRAANWLFHRGDVLSVILDKRDGSVTVETVPFDTIATITGDWNSFDVDVEKPTTGSQDRLLMKTLATAPSGASASEWAHDLIPVTSNILGGSIISLPTDGSQVEVQIPIAAVDSAWKPAMAWHPRQSFGTSATTAYAPWKDGATFVHRSHDYGSTLGLTWGWDVTLSTLLAGGSGGGTDFTRTAEPGYFRTGPCIAYGDRVTLSNTDDVMGFSRIMLAHARDLEDEDVHLTPSWFEETGIQLDNNATRVRFTSFATRQYHVAGVDAGSSVTYEHHPRDKDHLGTPDGLGGALGVDVSASAISDSGIRIEGSYWTDTETVFGRMVQVPTDALMHVVQHIEEEDWWLDNRDRVLAGTLNEEEQMVCYRPARTTGYWNDLETLIESVLEVKPCDIRDLHADAPDPDWFTSINYPFAYSGESPFAVPADWLCGGYDTGGDLDAWATLWGLTPETTLPGFATLAAVTRKIWVYNSDSSGDFNGFACINMSTHDPSSSTTYDTVHGFDYYRDKAMSAAVQRKLFGGAGSPDDYVWITRADADTQITGTIGVPLPRGLRGERFNPTISTDSSATHLYGDPPGGAGTNYGAGYNDFEGHVFYRQPDPTSGTWLRVISDGEAFRMLDHAAPAPQRMFHNDVAVGETTYYVAEIDRSDEQNTFSDIGPMEIVPQNSSESTEDTIKTNNPGWPTVSNIWSQDGRGVRMVYVEEGYGEVTWNEDEWLLTGGEPPAPYVYWKVFWWIAPSSITVRWRRVADASMPITPSGIREWAESFHPCWHCQLIPDFP